jgi:hypothetical protein
MPAARVGGRYRSQCEWHEVLATRDPFGRWQVVDTARSEIVVVETLTGHDDRLDQAIALARDYAAEHQADRTTGVPVRPAVAAQRSRRSATAARTRSTAARDG